MLVIFKKLINLILTACSSSVVPRVIYLTMHLYIVKVHWSARGSVASHSWKFFCLFLLLGFFSTFFYFNPIFFDSALALEGHVCPQFPAGDMVADPYMALKYFNEVLKCYDLHILEQPVGPANSSGVYSQADIQAMSYNAERKKQIDNYTFLRDKFRLECDRESELSVLKKKISKEYAWESFRRPIIYWLCLLSFFMVFSFVILIVL